MTFDTKTNRLWLQEGYETVRDRLRKRREEEAVYGEA
jgi:hypothetical protein